ncbi:cell division protein ZapE [Microbacterium lushaniae]|uniref:cell division protein ZapE n=1 Tax=Microbacterium lushaniae TaxID=2614639 RepID=UPI0023B0EFF7|nr:cell division protein ZapE [Microbacterium lushaniae]
MSPARDAADNLASGDRLQRSDRAASENAVNRCWRVRGSRTGYGGTARSSASQHPQLHRSERDAVERAIDDVTGSSRFLFFDELHVHDSGDARLLTRLLDHVFARELTVLATSNYAPDDLLPNPSWHHIFEPGIALIKANMDVLPLHGPTDYRTTHDDHSRGFAAGIWSRGLHPFTSFAPHSVTVHGRSFVVTSTGGGELTATFDQPCRTPTSTVEYLQWARDFTRWAVADIPRFSAADPEAQQ